MYKTIDLFAGAGGLSFGFLQTGEFEFLAAAEINANARKTYRKNIIKDPNNFIFIDNVIGYDFENLNERLGGIDIVIGGPPCQGFSNANRQKNHLISMNNGLIKEYFRAIKQIRPLAFVMENVSMLRSETHRFYDSDLDNDLINKLIEQGFNIPKRADRIIISENVLNEINIYDLVIDQSKIDNFLMRKELFQLIRTLGKNLNNKKRLPNFIIKNAKNIENNLSLYLQQNEELLKQHIKYKNNLENILIALSTNNLEGIEIILNSVVSMQKALLTVNEIYQNKLIGNFQINHNDELCFETYSYSVIDYINAILGNDYVQCGDTINAEVFGVPQERRRYITIGIRRDVCKYKEIQLSTPEEMQQPITVGDAILDLVDYKVSTEKECEPIPYKSSDVLSDYAKLMRQNSLTVKNHIATKTTDTAMKRFIAIEQGKNFHSLSVEMKDTYSRPERTQNTIYLRLNPNKPSGTVVNVRKSMWIHPTLNRAISVREAARLQSFPDLFEFIGTKDSQYQQVGNAVPPLLAKGIAEQILQLLQ